MSRLAVSRVPRREPPSWRAAVLVNTGFYVVVQPSAQLLLHAMGQRPLPFSTGTAWLAYIAAVALLGASVGAGWIAVQRSTRGQTRMWLSASLGAVTFTAIVIGPPLSALETPGWIAVNLVGGLLAGAAWYAIERAGVRIAERIVRRREV